MYELEKNSDTRGKNPNPNTCVLLTNEIAPRLHQNQTHQK